MIAPAVGTLIRSHHRCAAVFFQF
eukprot:COSAG06_NODE_11251_length_1538_cov_1.862404_4_plen_23_part_01